MRGHRYGRNNYFCQSFAYEFVIAIMADDDEKRKIKLMHEFDDWPHNLVEFERSTDQLYGTGIYGTGIIFEHVFS